MRALVLLAGLLVVGSADAQPLDSLSTPTLPASVDVRTPRGAVTRALLVPGLGQVYNRQPVKAPIAAALVVGGVAYAVNRQRRYIRYRRATVFAGCAQESIPDDREVFAQVCADEAPGYEDEWQALGSPVYSAIQPIRDRVRGQRDVSVLVVAVAYAFQALDAYVAAELADFDVSPDVVVRVAGPESPAVSLSIRL